MKTSFFVRQMALQATYSAGTGHVSSRTFFSPCSLSWLPHNWLTLSIRRRSYVREKHRSAERSKCSHSIERFQRTATMIGRVAIVGRVTERQLGAGSRHSLRFAPRPAVRDEADILSSYSNVWISLTSDKGVSHDLGQLRNGFCSVGHARSHRMHLQ